ncbi:MAG TPA: hypothetical protein VLB84_15265 [Bacteroidia bacterium]|nr:hypothetical protein [Bacteroidia bacterium]
MIENFYYNMPQMDFIQQKEQVYLLYLLIISIKKNTMKKSNGSALMLLLND